MCCALLRCALVLAALLSPCLLPGPAAADRLTGEECDALKSEQDKLAAVRSDMQRGPEWAKANLPTDRLARIRHLIEIEEQIAFRCQKPRVAAAHAPHGAHDAHQATGAAADGEAATPPRKSRKKGHKANAEAKADAPAEAKPDADGASQRNAEPAQPKKSKKSKQAKPAGEAAAGGAGSQQPKSPDPTAQPTAKAQ